jgi:uncharacterized phage infection (PIP) family protein YhgE
VPNEHGFQTLPGTIHQSSQSNDQSWLVQSNMRDAPGHDGHQGDAPRPLSRNGRLPVADTAMSKNRVIGQTARISKAKPATALHKFCQTASSSAIKLVERQKEVEREQELLENQIEAQKTRIAELEAREQTFTECESLLLETLNASKNALVQRYDRLRAKAVSLKETVDFFITEHGLLKEYLSKNKEVTSSLKAEVAECIIRADASDKGLQVISNISGQLKTLRNDIAAELANSKYIFSHIPLQMD